MGGGLLWATGERRDWGGGGGGGNSGLWTATGHLSSSLLLLPSNLQFSCMKYLVLFAIYKIFLYPLGNNEKFSVLFLVMNIFFA